MEKISEIADDRDNRDQFKALKMLAAAKSSGIVLPEPMSDGEMIERLVRLIKPAGMEVVQIAYRKAFPHAKRSVNESSPKLEVGDLSAEMKEMVAKVTSLKVFNKMFPEVKQPGTPKGYPSGRGIVAQRAWLQRAAAKILLDREQEKVNGIVKQDQEIMGGGDQPAEDQKGPDIS